MKQNPKIKNFYPTWPFGLSRDLACGGTRPISWWRVTFYKYCTDMYMYLYHQVYFKSFEVIFVDSMIDRSTVKILYTNPYLSMFFLIKVVLSID